MEGNAGTRGARSCNLCLGSVAPSCLARSPVRCYGRGGMKRRKVLIRRCEIRRKVCQTIGLFLLLTFQVYGQGRETITGPTEIKTRTGMTYKSIRNLKVAPDGLEIEFTPPGGGIGMTKIEFKDLPADLQQQYGYDIEKATAYKTERAKEQATVAAKMWADYTEATNRLAIRLAKEQEEAERLRIAQEREAEQVRLAKEEAERQRQEAEKQRLEAERQRQEAERQRRQGGY